MLLIIGNKEIPLPGHNHMLKPRLNGHKVHHLPPVPIHHTHPRLAIPAPNPHIQIITHAHTLLHLPILNQIGSHLGTKLIDLANSLLETQEQTIEQVGRAVGEQADAGGEDLFGLEQEGLLLGDVVEYGQAAGMAKAVQARLAYEELAQVLGLGEVVLLQHVA